MRDFNIQSIREGRQERGGGRDQYKGKQGKKKKFETIQQRTAAEVSIY
jgi:hypothetical protein